MTGTGGTTAGFGAKSTLRPDAAFAAFLSGLMAPPDVASVVRHADQYGVLLVEAVVALGFMNEAKAYAAHAEWMGRPFVDLHDTPPNPTAARLLPERVSRARQILAIAHDNRTMTYASSSLFNDEVDRDVAFASGRRPQMVVVAKSQLADSLNQSYRTANDIEKLLDRIQLKEPVKPIDVATSGDQDSPVIDLCNRIIAAAIAAGASDVHIEPSANGALVRHRVCGILETLLTLPASAVRGVTNRFKLMAKTDIATKMKPQDGAFRVAVGAEVVDVRLSALPTIHGEKLVMRVIQGGSAVLGIDTLGYDNQAQRMLIAALSKPDGLVLCTGPTGCGKTTVLYAALKFLQTGRVNIVTVEDPVERQVEGVTQIAVNTKSGTSFVNVLRSVMRQDPNVIMVGEIRDNEVAEIVGQAAYTGHLVLSSLHTIDAASAITRLINLGLQPFKVAESLNAIVSQRLLRKLCPSCRVTNDEATALRLGAQHGVPSIGASVGRGCDRCKQSGYADRIAVPEILAPDEALRTAIRNGAGAAEIRGAMRTSGSPSMRETALALVAQGVTSIEEVNRVLTDHSDEVSSTGSVPAVAPAPAVPAAAVVMAVVSAEPAPPAELVLPDLRPIMPAPAAPPAIAVLGPRPLPSRRVLVTDDDRMIRLLVRMLLEKEGFKVLEAENGAVGMETARREKPDLMLVDLQMPDMDGFQVIQMMRADPALSSIPLVVLTSESGSGVETKVLEMGADDYLTKPFEPEVMISRVRAAFRRAQRIAAA
ncbi:MAG: ATPase, T2SS/T4P/T4SS family [Acidobacteriota bacterium]|nr:ATPase, T2SS/T4P/T4SS family [Acidobacteriota bacterium]